ncbi:MAG TPA: hypothetical protein VHO01_06910 [Jatrophihabitans sp.]|nr:hypothetical protein [Jatrophihabitans sp.]
MTATRFVVTGELTALAEQARAAGLGNGVDYYIRGIPFTGSLGADLIGFSFDGSQYCVERRSTDRTRDLLRTDDFELARQRFLSEAQQLAASFIPRRAHRPDPEPAAAGTESPLITVLLAVGLGFLFGLLVIPALVLLTVLAVASGSYSSGGSGPKRPWRGDWSQKLSFAVGAVAGLAVLAVGGLALLAR